MFLLNNGCCYQKILSQYLGPMKNIDDAISAQCGDVSVISDKRPAHLPLTNHGRSIGQY